LGKVKEADGRKEGKCGQAVYNKRGEQFSTSSRAPTSFI